MKILHVHEKQLFSMRYSVETLILMKCVCIIMISVLFWFTKNVIIKITLGLFLRYSNNLGNFHPDIFIEAIFIIKNVYISASSNCKIPKQV